jgi:hypothetical protein
MHDLLKDELPLVFIVNNLLEEKPNSEEKFDLIGVDAHEPLSHFLNLNIVLGDLSPPHLDGMCVNVLREELPPEGERSIRGNVFVQCVLLKEALVLINLHDIQAA